MPSKVREKANEKFKFLLKERFLKDLKVATILTSIPEGERGPEFQGMLDSLRGQYLPGYIPEGKCPSLLFKYVSRKLQEKYDVIHDGICGVLYESCFW